MSIEKIFNHKLIDNKESDNATEYKDVTLAFAFDGGYLDCFKVMVTSMAMNNTLVSNPIKIYTDDPDLCKDRFVNLIADEVVLLNGEKKDLLYRLAKDNVKRPERANWNRGTFLKWAVFEEQATEKLLFLDVDMIVSGSLNGLFTQYQDKPLVTSPQFQQSIREDNTDEQLKNMLSGKFDGKHIKRINSGMMLVGSQFLSSEFFETITNFASERVSIHEQGLLSEYFGDKRKYIGMISSAYNFQDSFLRLASKPVYEDLLLKISVLHYAGPFKPWNEKGEKLRHFKSIELWHYYKANASKLLNY